jgi:hypothetical protein
VVVPPLFMRPPNRVAHATRRWTLRSIWYSAERPSGLSLQRTVSCAFYLVLREPDHRFFDKWGRCPRRQRSRGPVAQLVRAHA